MRTHRPRAVTVAIAGTLTIAALAPIVQPAGTTAQSAAPAATSSSETMCGVDYGSPMLSIDGHPAYASPHYLVEDPAPYLAQEELDVLTGQELLVEVPSGSSDTSLARLPIDSLAATIDLDHGPPRWLTTQVDGDTATITIPTDATGEGELAFRVGTCESWSMAARFPITVSDAASAADCPTDQPGLQRWYDSMDQRARLGGRLIPTLGLANLRGRYTDVTLHDSGSYASLPYDPSTPVVRARAGSRITLRPLNRELEPVGLSVAYLKVPPDAELERGSLTTLEDAGVSPQARITDDARGISLRVPKREGRYLLSSDSDWRDRCVRSTETFTFAIVESR